MSVTITGVPNADGVSQSPSFIFRTVAGVLQYWNGVSQAWATATPEDSYAAVQQILSDLQANNDGKVRLFRSQNNNGAVLVQEYVNGVWTTVTTLAAIVSNG